MKKRFLYFLAFAVCAIASAWADNGPFLMAKGGLQNVGNWADNDVYLLYPNSEGWYEGVISMVDATDLTNGNTWWGSRGDLFFKDPATGVQYGPENPSYAFLTPGCCGTCKITANPSSVFQACGGDYKCFINLETMEARFECVREYWMESVFCVGTLDGIKAFDSWDYTYQLAHKGNGVYQGLVTVVASGNEGDGGMGRLSVRAAYGDGKTEGRYGTAGGGTLKHGMKVAADRLNSDCYWTIAPGEWQVTFDMNNHTLRVNKPEDPNLGSDSAPITPPIYAVGGLMGTGNWEITANYPLYMNQDGVYEGIIQFSDQTLVTGPSETHWGNRNDLFFIDLNWQKYGASAALTNDEKFITPSRTATCAMGMGNGSLFQAHSGTYKAFVNLRTMEVRFVCLAEAWMEKVYAVGTIAGHRWKGYLAEDQCNALTHIGHGIYRGILTLEEDVEGSGRATFGVVTSYNANAEGYYSPMTDKETVDAGAAPLKVYRFNDVGRNASAPTGTWLVTFDWNKGTLEVTPTTDKLSITNAGWATYVTPFNTDFSLTEGIAAYQIVAVNEAQTSLTLSPITFAPAGTAVVVNAEVGEYTTHIAALGQAMESTEENLLLAASSTLAVDAPMSYFVLANVGGSAAFCPVKEGTSIPAGKGYLHQPTDSNVRAFYLDGETAISATQETNGENVRIYTLQGMRIDTTKPHAPGIYIRGNRKVMMK